VGTHLGDLPGFSASQRTVTIPSVTGLLFDGERIRGHWQVVDRLGVFQQLKR
jgi:predicted ester cyclase